MQVLGIKKFLLDYLISFVLIVFSLYLFFGGITAMDTRAEVSLYQSCSADFKVSELLQNLQKTLKDGERCEVVSPCVEWRTIQCEGTLPISGLYNALLGGDLLVYRVTNVLNEPYGIVGYKNPSSFRFEANWVYFLMFYVLILVEAGAMFFALWRQKELKWTFSLPVGSKKDQILKPILFAAILASLIILMNHLVFSMFGFPDTENRRIIVALLDSAYGIVFVVIVAPLVEELTFRGVLLRFFVDRKRILLGTIVVSSLFSIFHGFVEKDLGWQLYISSIYFFGSVVLCTLYIKQKNLWSPIIFHGAYNGTIVAVYKLLA